MITEQELTPNRTANPTPKGLYVKAKRGWYGNYHQSELDFVWGEVCDVVSMATKYRLTRCTEAHWMAVVVHPLLKILRRLKKYRNIGFEMLEVADL